METWDGSKRCKINRKNNKGMGAQRNVISSSLRLLSPSLFFSALSLRTPTKIDYLNACNKLTVLGHLFWLNRSCQKQIWYPSRFAGTNDILTNLLKETDPWLRFGEGTQSAIFDTNFQYRLMLTFETYESMDEIIKCYSSIQTAVSQLFPVWPG